MDISDLLKMLSGGAEGGSPQAGPLSGDFGPTPPTPTPATGWTEQPSPAAQPGGVSSLLSPMPPPQSAVPQAAPPPATAGLQPVAPPQPSTPPSTDAGLGGFLSHMVQKATARNPDTGMSWGDKLGDVGATMTDLSGTTDGASAALHAAAAGRVQDAQAEQHRIELQKMADGLGMSPREKLIFAANPEAWVKANAERLGYHEQAGGSTANYGEPGTSGATSHTAPLIGQEKGEGYKVTPDGITDLGGVKPSPQQQLEDQVKAAQQKAVEAFHAHMAGVAQQNANTRAKKSGGLGNGGDWRSRVVGHGSVQ